MPEGYISMREYCRNRKKPKTEDEKRKVQAEKQMFQEEELRKCLAAIAATPEEYEMVFEKQ
jgi:hypothetical protein